MGPGKYDLPDFLDEMELRPVGKRGICAKTGPRVQPPDTVQSGHCCLLGRILITTQ